MGQALKVIKFDSDEQNKENKASGKSLNSSFASYLVPLRTAAIITAILGVISLILEVKIYFQYRYDIYLARLFPTLFSLIVLILLQTKFGKKQHILLTHIFLFAILASLSFVGFRIPSLYIYNLSAASLFILSLSIFLSWGKINQIIAGFYFVALFCIAAFMSELFVFGGDSLYLMLTSSFLILVISVIASGHNTFNEKKENFSYENLNDNLVTSDDNSLDFFENSVVPLFQCNLNGNFEYLNNAVKELLALDSETNFNELNFFDDILKNDKIKSHFLKKIENKGRVENYRFKYTQKSGSEDVLVMDCKSKMINEEIYIEGSLRNITAQYKTDKALRKEIETLQHSKRQKSNIIPNLTIQSEKKSNVISKMGHELRNPMNSVLGFLTLIENGLFENENELKEFSHSAKLSAESLLGLINDVVEISKIQEGSVEIVKLEFNLHEELGKLTSSLGPHFTQNNINFSLQIEDDVPQKVILDQSKYTQIVTNLLRNAIAATEDGSLSLSINKRKNNDGIEQLITSVQDSGRGIPNEELENIINSSDYTKNSESKVTANILHIMICKELVLLLGGEIFAESEIGKGTRLSFSVDLDSVNNSDEVSTLSSKDVQVGNSSKPKLLLVEDNPISRKVEQKLLQEAGYTVECVENGADAIEHLEYGSYDLVLMDIELKDMNGLDVTKKIRQLSDKVNKIPIIAVTAHSSMKDREKCLLAGMNDYISKPINITFLKMTIDQWLNEAKVN